MMHNEQRIADRVLRRIESEKTTMRPRAFFLAGTFLVVLGTAFLLLTAIYCIGLFSYRFRHHSPFNYLAFGWQGMGVFIATFPWLPLLVALVGIAAGIFLVWRYSVGYRYRIRSLVVVIMLVILVLGIGLDLAGLQTIARHSRHLEGLYRMRFVGPTWVTGIVKEIQQNAVLVQSPNNDVLLIILSEETTVIPAATIQSDAWIHAIGRRDDGTFRATALTHTTAVPNVYCSLAPIKEPAAGPCIVP